MKNTLLSLLVCLLPVGLSAQQADNNQEEPLAFTHATVIDATGSPAKPDMTIVVTGDRIAALGETGKLAVPRNAQVVDATGKFLIPGLWDMHIHPWSGKNYLALFVANGVTGVRLMWGEPVHHKWRQEISAGKLIGPRMVIASRGIDGSDLFYSGSIVVSSEDEGRQVVRNVKKMGADLVKVYHDIPRDVYFAIADEAKKQGIPFAGHVPCLVSAAEASDAGQQSIEHCSFVWVACSTEGEEELKRKVKEIWETWVTGPTSLSHARDQVKFWSDIPYSEKKAVELFARLAKNDTWVCPTLMGWHSLSFRDEEHFANDPLLKYMPLSTKDSWKNDVYVAWATGEGRADYRKLREKQLAIVSAMRRAGVGLLAGTDTIAGSYYLPGFGLHDELALFVQAGLSPMQALQTATYNAAKCLGKLDSMGTIEQGKIADLVLLDANPLQDIGNTRRITTVVVGGKIFQRAALQKMLAKVEAQVEVEHLHQAAVKGEIERVKVLVSEGADVNVRNDEGLTPLHCAAREGHKEIVELLLAHGADVNIGGADYNRTATEFAMRSNHTDIVQLLVSKGADISPLHFALYMKDETKARSLIEGGADVNRWTPNGTTPLDRAVVAGLKDIAELLIAKGADVNAKDNWNWTPLHSAVYGHRDIVELLITEGANVNATDVAGRTPLWYAKKEGYTEIVELLKKHGAKEEQ
ncbi:MAG: ankyrin repeat domain-containing protein [Planctomycetota bacterium]|jgi:ankyrin repeat protein